MPTPNKKLRREADKPIPIEVVKPKPSEVEQDKGYGKSHGYGPGHGGPSGPGDVPGDATPAVGKTSSKELAEEELARPSESGPGESA